ncbi:MAG TPA: DUF350 domain-containing protein [Vicinamibacteria bacterium]|nr:DUF350 domain-containing protein [Vicinamibacteria bacterium]
MDVASILAGLIAFAVSVFGAVLLVFVTYRLNTLVTRKLDEEQLLLSGNHSVAVALGAIVLAQALLLRHAVFPSMVLIRDLFVRPAGWAHVALVLGQCLVFFLVLGILAFGSVAIATWLFSRMTRAIPEREEILKGNLALAIFFAFVVLGVALVINEGIADLARSLIPEMRNGFLRID